MSLVIGPPVYAGSTTDIAGVKGISWTGTMTGGGGTPHTTIPGAWKWRRR